MKPQLNVLATSISKKVPLLKLLRRALNSFSPHSLLHGGDVDNECIGKHFVDHFWNMPHQKNLTIKEILAFCKKNNIYYIIPTRDGELPFFASIKNKLANHNLFVMVSDPFAIDLSLDKLAFCQHLKKVGINTIPTFETVAELSDGPCVVKERYGSGSKNIGINLNLVDAKAFSKKVKKPIFQPYIKGKEISADIYIDLKHSPRGIVLRTRDQVNNGESVVTTTFRDPQIEEVCKNFIEAVPSFYGHINLQFIQTEQKSLYLLECNPRFGGASTLSYEVGLESFLWFFYESMGNDLSRLEFIRSKNEKMLIRHPQDYYLDL